MTRHCKLMHGWYTRSSVHLLYIQKKKVQVYIYILLKRNRKQSKQQKKKERKLQTDVREVKELFINYYACNYLRTQQ